MKNRRNKLQLHSLILALGAAALVASAEPVSGVVESPDGRVGDD